MADAAVLVATAAPILGPLALLFAFAVRDFRRRAPAVPVPASAPLPNVLTLVDPP